MWLAGWVQPRCEQGAVRGWGWGCSLVSSTYSPCVIEVQPQHSPHRHAHSWGPWENKKRSLVITGKPTGPGVPSDLGLPRGHCPPIKQGVLTHGAGLPFRPGVLGTLHGPHTQASWGSIYPPDPWLSHFSEGLLSISRLQTVGFLWAGRARRVPGVCHQLRDRTVPPSSDLTVGPRTYLAGRPGPVQATASDLPQPIMVYQ